MPLPLLPWPSPLPAFEAQAAALLTGWRERDRHALAVFRHHHPRFLRPDAPWLPRPDTDDEAIGRAALTDADARLAVARAYAFLDWASLEALVTAGNDPQSAVARFEAAVEMVVEGHLEALQEAVRVDPALVRARSSRVTCFDPPRHRATLLHYIAANGVEGDRQRSPANAPAIAKALLEAGADPNALADLFGGQCTTFSLLVSSDPPARAGVQIALIDTLLDHGAGLEPRGEGNWVSPLMTALVFNFPAAAETLARRGAPVDSLAAAAGRPPSGDGAGSATRARRGADALLRG